MKAFRRGRSVMKLLERVHAILDSVIGSGETVYVAYSGGKDSTALSVLLYDWILRRERWDVGVVLVNSDTLSEIPEMREWTISFMKQYVEKLKKHGVEASYSVFTPKPEDTFYWRALIRGYPAPTFKHRWCVELLKRKPAMQIIRSAGSVMLLGHRDEESSARSKSLSSKTGFCPLSAGRCASYYLQLESDSWRVYPIRELRELEVWKLLEHYGNEFDLDKLFELYGYGAVKARYGCWHCTLVRRQLAHYILGKDHLYYEAVRLIYRWISDVPELRAVKNRGYSRHGYLVPEARSLLLHALRVAEELSGVRLYGLDEARVKGYTLREILYELEPSEANRVVLEVERDYVDKSRLSKLEELRYPRKTAMLSIVDKLEAAAKNSDIRDLVMNVLSEVVKLI